MKCGESDKRNKVYEASCTPENFFRLLILREDPLIVDIGAHRGESVKFFKDIFPACDIYSIEPNSENFDKLQKDVSSTAKVFNLAIAAKSGKAIFFQYDKSHLSSLYAINKKSVDSHGYAKKCIEKQIEVRCLTLDDFAQEFGLESNTINLLKIDAQGAEIDILEGGQKTLQKVENITLELNFFDFYTKKSSFGQIEKLLPGFELYAITKLSQNPKNFRTDWAEVFYRKI